jgi:hypothetical protein
MANYITITAKATAASTLRYTTNVSSKQLSYRQVAQLAGSAVVGALEHGGSAAVFFGVSVARFTDSLTRERLLWR